MVPHHPPIKRPMKEQISQQGDITDPCGLPFSRGSRVPSSSCTGAWSHRSMYNSTHAQFVCFLTARKSSSCGMESKYSDIEIEHPSVPPATLARHTYGLQYRFSRP